LRPRLAALAEVAPVTDRERAAQLLRESLAAKDVGLAVSAAWPADPLADPLLTFYLAAAAYPIGGGTWRNISRRIEVGVVRQQLRAGEECDGFAASGPFAEQNGRFGVHALAVVTIEIYYRYCRLGVWD